MGNSDSSADGNVIPTLEYIFKYGPQFDHDARIELKQNEIIFPFQNDTDWEKNVALLTQQPNESNEFANKITNLQNLFKSLSNHTGSKFIQHLKTGISSTSILSKEKKELITTFLLKTLPFIKRLILEMPQLLTKDHNFQYMQPKIDKMVKINRIQIASILAACFFDLVAAHCCFGDELRGKGIAGKFDCYINYFEYVRLKGMDSDWAKEEVIIYRRCLKAEKCSFLQHEKLLNNNTKLCNFKVYGKKQQPISEKYGFKQAMKEIEEKEEKESKIDEIINERIEDCVEGIHADFANEYIGGGVLNGGNVQEEIRFTVSTECIISKLFCPQPMENDEAIIIFKSQQFCDYIGYGARFECRGLMNRETERHKSVIVGIDAVNFFSRRKQYQLRYMMRELCKAYIGFSIDTQGIIGEKLGSVATGNWGCGMFGGDPQFKAMIQWIAVTLSNRDVIYYTFNDKRVENKLKEIVNMMIKKEVTIAQLWKILNYKRCDKTQTDMFDINSC